MLCSHWTVSSPLVFYHIQVAAAASQGQSSIPVPTFSKTTVKQQGSLEQIHKRLDRIEGKVDQILKRLDTVGGSGSPAAKQNVQSMCQTPPQLAEERKVRFVIVLHSFYMIAVTIASSLFYGTADVPSKGYVAIESTNQ